jgi:AraC family transcriptional regulator
MDADRTFEQARTVPLPMHQLLSALDDISRALDQASGEDRGNAAMYLRRAEASLKAPLQEVTPRAAGAGPRLLAWQVRRVKEHVEANLASSIRNRDLAALAKLSEFHFSVAFRNSVGQTPHEFLIRRRMHRAQRLMLSTDLPLCEIAGECGLADQAHLSRLFRRVVGATPASWRRVAREA